MAMRVALSIVLITALAVILFPQSGFRIPQSLPYLSGEGSGFSDRSPPMAFPARSNALPDSFFGAFLGSSGRFKAPARSNAESPFDSSES
jgi:hypothetical protein